jgi:hypothetical protein
MTLAETCDRIEAALPKDGKVMVGYQPQYLRTLVELGELQTETVWTPEMGLIVYEEWSATGDRFEALKARVAEAVGR